MRKQQGATLIEVLVTVLVLSVGLLGLASTQVLSMKNANSAHQRYVATLVVQDIAERMRANPEGVSLGSYDGEVSGSDTEGSDSNCSGCSAAALAAMDKRIWGRLIKTNLPSGHGEISSDSGNVSVKLMWTEQSGGESYGDADDGQKKDAEFEMTVEL